MSKQATIERRIAEWLANGETGSSSRNMAFWLGFGVKAKRDWFFSPCDPADFDRCLRLLEVVPELRERIPEMAELSVGWERIVARWDEIEASHLNEVGLGWTKGEEAPRTYQLMIRIRSGEG